MTLGIMQPYIFPYIGYFQLMNAVDEFVIYDNIQFSKKGWINRNRILINGKDFYITFPLKKDSDFLDVKDRYLADNWEKERKKMLNKIAESYKKAAHFNIAYPIIEKCILSEEKKLFNCILNSLNIINEYIDIVTPLIVSSTVPLNHELKGGQKVLEICKARNADVYYNSMGGVGLYNKESFQKEGITLNFLKTNVTPYLQFTNEFVPALSIVDIMMFNTKEQIQQMLHQFTLE